MLGPGLDGSRSDVNYGDDDSPMPQTVVLTPSTVETTKSMKAMMLAMHPPQSGMSKQLPISVDC